MNSLVGQNLQIFVADAQNIREDLLYDTLKTKFSTSLPKNSILFTKLSDHYQTYIIDNDDDESPIKPVKFSITADLNTINTTINNLYDATRLSIDKTMSDAKEYAEQILEDLDIKLKQQISQNTKNIAKHAPRITANEHSIDDLYSYIFANNEKHNEYDRQIESLTSNLETLSNNHNTLQNDHTALSSNVTDLNNNVQEVKTDLANKQNKLQSGITIKTINSETLLGPGNITIPPGVITVNGKDGEVILKTSDLENDNKYISGSTAGIEISSNDIDNWNNKIDGVEINGQHGSINNGTVVFDDIFLTKENTIKINGQSILKSENSDITIDAAGNYSGDIVIPAQVNSDWDVTDTSNKACILHKPTIPTNLSDLQEDSSHKLVTDEEKTNWDNKINGVKLNGNQLEPDSNKIVNVNLSEYVKTGVLSNYVRYDALSNYVTNDSLNTTLTDYALNTYVDDKETSLINIINDTYKTHIIGVTKGRPTSPVKFIIRSKSNPELVYARDLTYSNFINYLNELGGYNSNIYTVNAYINIDSLIQNHNMHTTIILISDNMSSAMKNIWVSLPDLSVNDSGKLIYKRTGELRTDKTFENKKITIVNLSGSDQCIAAAGNDNRQIRFTNSNAGNVHAITVEHNSSITFTACQHSIIKYNANSTEEWVAHWEGVWLMEWQDSEDWFRRGSEAQANLF